MDEVLKKSILTDSLTVDRNMFEASRETWIHVDLNKPKQDCHPPFSHLGSYPKKGILTWKNSD